MILKNGWIIENNQLVKKDILIENGIITKIENQIEALADALDVEGCLVMPGATDVHVHLREPGFSHKETIKTGTMAAAKGGFTTILAMPNLSPVPDCYEHLQLELEKINADAVVHVYPYGSLTKGEKGTELADLEYLYSHTCAISDDGVGVNNISLLEKAMAHAAQRGYLIASHAEDSVNSKLSQGEYVAVRREIELAKKYRCRYHFCHLSTKESFMAVKEARRLGYQNITCEVTPHHMFLNEAMIKDGNWKMNPPLRSEEDRLATLEALLDGTASMIASDHAPHSESEKSKPYEECPNGILGLETSIPIVYTNLIQTKKATYSDFLRWFVDAPNQIFRLPKNQLAVGFPADITCLDISKSRVYRKEEIASIGKNSPYIGMKLTGFPRYTLLSGKIVWSQL